MLALLLILSGMTAVQAELPDAARVRRLVVQLDADQLARREAAERALIALGPDILEMLPPSSEQA